jgi:hypothetical protein
VKKQGKKSGITTGDSRRHDFVFPLLQIFNPSGSAARKMSGLPSRPGCRATFLPPADLPGYFVQPGDDPDDRSDDYPGYSASGGESANCPVSSSRAGTR